MIFLQIKKKTRTKYKWAISDMAYIYKFWRPGKFFRHCGVGVLLTMILKKIIYRISFLTFQQSEH